MPICVECGRETAFPDQSGRCLKCCMAEPKEKESSQPAVTGGHGYNSRAGTDTGEYSQVRYVVDGQPQQPKPGTPSPQVWIAGIGTKAKSMLDKFLGTTRVTKVLVATALVALITIVAVSNHKARVSDDWEYFLRTEIGFANASEAEIEDLIDFSETQRKESGFSREEYKTMLRTAAENGYFY